jgi:hypothetical protein
VAFGTDKSNCAGVNNTISQGSGTTIGLNLEGIFNFDFTDASTILGASWTIVAGSILSNTTFGTSFSVADFTEVANVWTSSGGAYQFSELTGMLTAVPEPSTALAGLLLGAGLLRRKRNDPVTSA